MNEILLAFTRLQDMRNVLDIALVTALIFVVLRLLRGTQAIQLIRGILLIALVFAVISQSMQLTAFNWLLRNGTPLILVAIPVIFQPELRRALERVGRTTPWIMRRTVVGADTQRVINEVVRAVEFLAENKYGALIVFEGATPLGDLVERGVPIDSELSSELISTIFFPKTALHDGAVVVRRDKIMAASVVLPLSERELADSQLGTRHRAAIGITEQSDAMTVVVSEETGSLAVARNGRILRLDSGRLRTLLDDFYRPFTE